MPSIKEIQQLITPELKALNELIASTLDSPNELMNRIVDNYLRTKGKQIRPILVILSAKLLGEVNENVIRAAAGRRASAQRVAHTRRCCRRDQDTAQHPYHQRHLGQPYRSARGRLLCVVVTPACNDDRRHTHHQRHSASGQTAVDRRA